MFDPVDTRDPGAVERQVQAAYHDMFPGSDAVFVPTAFDWLNQYFSGAYAGFQAIDAHYHNLEHTLQGTLCMARLLRGRQQAVARPLLTRRMFELGLLAMMFHDTGYLKRKEDREGTGAKYTLTHVARSVSFAEEFLSPKGVPLPEIRSIQNMIRCTGVYVDLDRIPFQSELERIVGYALGTSDLLGQMSADDYIDKLPTLYAEFEESARFYEGKMASMMTFASAADLIRRTPDFWEDYVLPKLNKDFWGLHRFLNRPYPDGPNYYFQKIEANLARLRQELSGTPQASP